ncbi:MAG: hypothetical protein NTY48_00255, partial [Candidatus Diapherotrites archaeon]|nr:hypothetical protein [Candidatus Diapherotrites archaeon]
MVPRRNINRSGGPLGRKAGLENSQAEKGSFRVGKPVSQEKLSQLLSKTHQARLGYLTAIGSGDKEQVQKAKANWMLLQNKFNSTKGAAELQDAIERGQVPGKRVTESQLPKHPKERIADSKTKAVRYGTDERHKKRKKFEIILFPEYEPSVFLMDVFNQTGNSKLNNQLSAKLGGAGIAILVREVGKER